MKMKFIITITLAGILSTASAQSTGTSADAADTPLGLMAELVDIKYMAESFMVRRIAEGSKDPKDVAEYNKVRRQMDRIIFQLMADMKRCNSISIYRKLDRTYRKNNLSDTATQPNSKRATNYHRQLQNAHSDAKTAFETKTSKTVPFTEIIEAVMGVLEFGWTMFTDIEEMKGKKVDGLSALLDKMRLSSVPDLMKAAEVKKPE
jgi:hypothetical protein